MMKRYFDRIMPWAMGLAVWLAACMIVAPPAFAQTNRVVTQKVSTAVPQAGNTEVLRIGSTGVQRVFVICTVANQALDAFLIQIKTTNAPALVTAYSAAGGYTTPTGILVGASGDLTTLAAGATGWFLIDTLGVDTVAVLASSGNVAGSTVSCYATGF